MTGKGTNLILYIGEINMELNKTSCVDLVEKYNLPSNVTNAWESVTAYGEVAYYTTGEMEYIPYHYGLFGLKVTIIPREKVYKKTLWGLTHLDVNYNSNYWS